MRIRNSIIVIILMITSTAFAQKGLDYFLPQEITYDPKIPTPESFLGYNIGEWHIGHDQLVYYMKELARVSDRITIEEYARTYEARPLVLLTITSPKNQSNINDIQSRHVALTDPAKSGNLNIDNMPSVCYMGYSVHGNEASGSNAAPLVAYYLAAAQGQEINDLLSNVVILLDPSFNPDGMNRFASWVNTHKSKNVNTDPRTREHNEAWPGGRTNHYWFDLNRDWLLVQHPESKGRIAIFHEWKPNILTDHHEMGSNNTFFFQPGIPSRTNPLTPKRNQELTYEIAKFHAEELDKIGSLYYSEESFDDFYYGKGSTYPDANGCIGILFEQASSRGHAQSTAHGDMDFPFTIRNQFRTSISTMKAAAALRKDLLGFQRDFYKKSVSEANRDRVKGLVFGDPNDAARSAHLADLIIRHDIDVHKLVTDIQSGAKTYSPANSYYVPLQQNQYKLIKAMFEKRTSFTDSLFYDVSAWTLPLAFDLNFAEVAGSPNVNPTPISKVEFPKGKVVGDKNSYAYLIEWNQYYAPSVAYQLLHKNHVVKAANKPFEITVNGKLRGYDRGTLMVPATHEGEKMTGLRAMLENLAQSNGVEIQGVSSGFTPSGIDLGSPSFSNLKDPKVLLLIGSGVSGYDAGEAWHLLDERFGIDATLVEADDFGRLTLSKYSTLVLVNGNYKAIGKENINKLKDWISAGGTVVAMRGAVSWLNTTKLTTIKMKKKKPVKGMRSYGNLSDETGAQVIGGAIFDTRLDLTHPLGYGFSDNQLPVFKRGTQFFEAPENAYAAPLRYTSKPLLAGYVSRENEALLKNSAAAIVYKHGGGKIICLADNPNFRAYWYGTTKLFLNAIFLGHTISSSAAEVPKKKEPAKKE